MSLDLNVGDVLICMIERWWCERGDKIIILSINEQRDNEFLIGFTWVDGERDWAFSDNIEKNFKKI